MPVRPLTFLTLAEMNQRDSEHVHIDGIIENSAEYISILINNITEIYLTILTEGGTVLQYQHISSFKEHNLCFDTGGTA